MSTFSGKLTEIPFISVDRFDGINIKSNIFFLSHCHMDHMIGLEISEGLPGPLYTSEISTVILKQRFKNLQNIVSVHAGVPYEIECTHDSEIKKIVVTAIPAGHCPGSVMFLFEYECLRILYTGDFRMSISSLQKVRNFKINSSEVLKFDSIYIDSTFLRKDYHQFPTQFESIATICEIILNWINQNDKHLVLIKLPARYGLEYLCIEIAKRLKMKIHVNLDEFDVYKCVAETNECFTKDAYTTRIHACSADIKRNIYALKCRQIFKCNDDVLIIRPSAMFWSDWNKTKDTATNKIKNIIRVCYSSHASYSEIEDMLLYLKPDRVLLNVLPEERQERDEMHNEVRKILDKFKNVPGTQQTWDEYTISKFDNVRSSMNLRKISESKTSDSEEELINIPIKRLKQ